MPKCVEEYVGDEADPSDGASLPFDDPDTELLGGNAADMPAQVPAARFGRSLAVPSRAMVLVFSASSSSAFAREVSSFGTIPLRSTKPSR